MPDNNNLKLNVTNFGPIVKAEIDLRPLTVFVGPSNTGKSYLAILIYALHRFFNGDATGPRLGYRESAFRQSTLRGMSDKDINIVAEWVTEALPQIRHKESITIPEQIAALIRPCLTLNEFSRALPNDIVRCFGIADLGRTVRYRSKQHTAIVLKKQTSTNSTPTDPYTYSLIVNKTTMNSEDIEAVTRNFLVEIPDTVPLRVIDNDLTREMRHDISQVLSIPTPRRERTSFLTQEFISALTDLIGSSIVAPLTRPAYYLPAGRASLMHQHRLMISSVVSRASEIIIQEQNVRPGLSGVVADFLWQLINLDDVWDDLYVSRHDVSERIENEMLRGAIRTEVPDVGIPMFTYQPEGWKDRIPLMNSSSMVSELAPIVLYLRHVVKPGEVLIIEEPESHLHPEMQVEFIRLLAAAVRSGVRVMLTTHSEWVLEELANLVRLSDLPESQRAGVGGTDVALTPDEVGVWLFRHDDASGGSEVKEIRLDVDSGGFPTEYDDVAIGTYNKWARIGNLIEEGHNGS